MTFLAVIAAEGITNFYLILIVIVSGQHSHYSHEYFKVKTYNFYLKMNTFTKRYYSIRKHSLNYFTFPTVSVTTLLCRYAASFVTLLCNYARYDIVTLLGFSDTIMYISIYALRV